MAELLNLIDSIKIEDRIAPNYLLASDVSRYKSYVIRLIEIWKVFRNSAAITESNAVPLILVKRLTDYINEFKNVHLDPFINGLPENAEVVNVFRISMQNLEGYHTQFFDTVSYNVILTLINAIDNYKLQDLQSTEAKLSLMLSDLEAAKSNFKSITEKISEESTKKVITNYAGIFDVQEKTHKKESEKWFTRAMWASGFFLVLFICSIVWKWFPNTIQLSEMRDNHISVIEFFNIPVLVSKVVVISFILFLISFCFRQYSINKNLQVINEQRKNAIESYELFAGSAGADNVAKTALLNQLAKSIYQMTHTGFLSAKQSDPSNNQLLEITKFIQEGAK